MEDTNSPVNMDELVAMILQKQEEAKAEKKRLYREDPKAYFARASREKRARNKAITLSDPDYIAEKERQAEEKRVEREKEEAKQADKKIKREERRALRDSRINAQKEKSNAYKTEIEFVLSKIKQETRERIKDCFFFPRYDVKEQLSAFKIHVQYYKGVRLYKSNEFTKSLPIPLIDQAKILLCKILFEIENDNEKVEDVNDIEEPTEEELEDIDYEDFDLGDM